MALCKCGHVAYVRVFGKETTLAFRRNGNPLMARQGRTGSKRPKAVRFGVIALGCVLVIVLLALVLPSGNPLDRFFNAITMPVQRMFGGIGASETRKNETQLRQDNGELREKNAAQSLQITALQEQLRQAEDALALHNFSMQYPQYEWMTAKVIARDPGRWLMQFTVNVGAKQGVTPKAVVFTADGIVGHVVEVEDNSCVVMTLMDGRSSVGCMIERSREQGICQGVLFSGFTRANMVLQYLDAGTEILPGERLLTSGVDSVYPSGFLIGHIDSVTPTGDGNGRQILVTSAVRFNTLSQVLIMKAPAMEATP